MVTGARFITTDTIIGGGLITLSGGNQVSGFTVDSDIRFKVENLTIANCRNDFAPTACGGAGGIANCGLLTVTNSTFIGNSSRVGAGGIFNFNRPRRWHCARRWASQTHRAPCPAPRLTRATKPSVPRRQRTTVTSEATCAQVPVIRSAPSAPTKPTPSCRSRAPATVTATAR